MDTHYSCLGNPKKEGGWDTIVHEVSKNQIWLSDFRRIDGRYDILWQCLWQGCHLLFFSPVMSQSPQTDAIPREGIYDSQVSFGGSVFRQKWEFRENLFQHLLFFKYLQLKIINIPKWHILGLHALNFCSCILEWHILLPFKGTEGLPGDTVVKKKKKKNLFANAGDTEM